MLAVATSPGGFYSRLTAPRSLHQASAAGQRLLWLSATANVHPHAVHRPVWAAGQVMAGQEQCVLLKDAKLPYTPLPGQQAGGYCGPEPKPLPAGSSARQGARPAELAGTQISSTTTSSPSMKKWCRKEETSRGWGRGDAATPYGLSCASGAADGHGYTQALRAGILPRGKSSVTPGPKTPPPEGPSQDGTSSTPSPPLIYPPPARDWPIRGSRQRGIGGEHKPLCGIGQDSRWG